MAAPLLKHQGFREENEARIVVVPATQHDLDELLATDPTVLVPPFKSIYSHVGLRRVRDHVVLFERIAATLPIKRVIVGPSGHQDDDFKKAKSVLGSRVAVARSQTPFIG